jgi:small subunit ribosomal protein S18
MPPRLPLAGALRSSTQPSFFTRLFSSTAAVAYPPHPTPSPRFPRPSLSRSQQQPPQQSQESQQPQQPQQQQQSSSSRNILGMVERSDRARRSPSGYVPGQAMTSIMGRMKNKAADMQREQMERLENQRNEKLSRDYLKQMPRHWAAGDVYAPHDMSPIEMRKWRRFTKRNADVIDTLGIRPLDMYTNFAVISDFTTPSGMIKHSVANGLRPVNQRKIAKMIRRAQGMGLYPTIHGHPEMIRADFLPQRRLI